MGNSGKCTREVCGSVRLGRKTPKSVWCNNDVKAAWKEVLTDSDEEAKERCIWRREEKG